jgi:UDP-N-acetyl-D-mannosaminuronic acid dehydrogenase
VTVDPDLLPFDEVVERSDILILCAPHKDYKNADMGGKPVIDVWGMLSTPNSLV